MGNKEKKGDEIGKQREGEGEKGDGRFGWPCFVICSSSAVMGDKQFAKSGGKLMGQPQANWPRLILVWKSGLLNNENWHFGSAMALWIDFNLFAGATLVVMRICGEQIDGFGPIKINSFTGPPTLSKHLFSL